MTINIPAVFTASKQQLAAHPAAARQPIHTGGDHGIQTFEPSGTPPGRWTRFKAALINVPFLGGLQTIRHAGAAVRIFQHNVTLLANATQFSDEFRQQMTADFGDLIADAMTAAMAARNGGSKDRAPFNAQRVVVWVEAAAGMAAGIGLQNNRALTRGRGFTDRYAQMWSLANHAQHQKFGLRQSEISATLRAADEMVANLEKNAVDPASLNGLFDDYQRKIAAATTPREAQKIAKRCMDAVQDVHVRAANRKTLETTRPASFASAPAPSAGRGRADSAAVASDSAASSSTAAASGSRAKVSAGQLQLVALLLPAQAPPSNGPLPLLSKETAAQAWKDLESVRNTLREELGPVEGMTDERVDAILEQVVEGRTELGDENTPAKDELLRHARNGAIVNEMQLRFNPAVVDSLLWNAVIEATAQHPLVNAPVSSLMETLARQMIDEVIFRAPRLLNNKESLPAAIAATRERLTENVAKAAQDHLDALESIEESTTLNPQQKTLLNVYAEDRLNLGNPRPQRLDPTQLRHFEAISNEIVTHLPRMRQAIDSGEPAVLFDSMARINGAFNTGTQAIVERAQDLWISSSIDGDEVQKQLFDVCVKLAFAKLSEDAKQSEQALSLFRPRAAEPPAAAASDSSPSSPREIDFDDPLTQFMHACDQSPSLSVAKLAMFLDDVRRLAVQAGHLPPEADPETDRRQAPGAPPPALYRTRPELLVRTLTDPSCGPDEGGQVNPNGTVVESLSETLIPRQFNPATVLSTERHAVTVAAAAGSREARIRTLQAFAGSDLIVNGKRRALELPDPGLDLSDPRHTPLIDDFDRLFAAPPQGEALGIAIGACVAADALAKFSADINAQAFSSPIAMGNLRDVHEVWREPDGSWRVRSTRTSHPLSQNGVPMRTDGVALYTLTHRITPAADGSPPRVELDQEASKAVFAF